MGHPPPQVRAYVEMRVQLVRMMEEEGENDEVQNIEPFYLVLPSQLVTQAEIEGFVDGLILHLSERLERHLEEVEGSGFMILELDLFKIIMAKTGQASNLGAKINNPLQFRGAFLVYNPTGADGYCLIQCLAAYFLLSEANGQAVNLKYKTKTLAACQKLVSTPDIEFPVAWDDIAVIESANGVSIYVYAVSVMGEKEEEEEEEEDGEEEGERDIIQVLDRRFLWNGEVVILYISIPRQDAFDPEFFLRNNRDELVRILRQEIANMRHPPPQVRAYAEMRVH